MTPPAGTATNQEISPWRLATMLMRHRRLITAFALVSAVVAGSLSLLSTRQYVASATFQPVAPKSTQSILSQLGPQIGLALGGGSANSPDYYANLLQSKELLRGVAQSTYQLAGPPAFTGDLFKYFQVDDPDQSRRMLLGIRAVSKTLSVRTDRTTGLVSLDISTESAELSAAVAARFLELVNESNLKRQQSQAHAERGFFEERLEAQRRELGAAEESLAAFQTRNRTYENSPELRAQFGRLERQVSLQQQMFLSLSQYYELAKVDELRDTPAIAIIQHPEGFVEPKARGTVLKAALALILGAGLGGFLAFLLEYVEGLTGQQAEEYARFRESVAEFLPMFRRAGRN